MVRVPLFLCLVMAVGWWLFADTYRRWATAEPDGSVIRFSHFGPYEDYELWREVIADFEREHPAIRVRQEYIVGLADRYNLKMRQQILSDTLPDVALIQLGPFHELAEHFADLTDLAPELSDGNKALSDVFDATGLSAFQYDGRQRGLPVSGGNLAVYCNLDCFERAARHHGQPVPLPGSDWTVRDFRRTAEQLTCDFDGDGRIDQFGFWLPRWIYYLPFIWSFGAQLTDESVTEWRLASTAAEEAFAFYRELAVDRRVCPREEEVPQLFQDVGFLTGRTAMCVNGPWFMPFLAKTGLADSYSVAPIPRGPGGRTTRVTWDGVVMRDDLPPRRRALALTFIRYLLSQTIQHRIARAGRAVPARRDSLSAFIDSSEHARRSVFVDALSYSRLQPLLPRFGEVDRAVNEHVGRLLDPARGLSARAMLQALAQDPAIRSSFGAPGPNPP